MSTYADIDIETDMDIDMDTYADSSINIVIDVDTDIGVYINRDLCSCWPFIFKLIFLWFLVGIFMLIWP